jgi:ABC-type branched-subunit amino acid transport system ATPase component
MYRGKSSLKIWASSTIFKTLTKVNNLTMGEYNRSKFTQSGHPKREYGLIKNLADRHRTFSFKIIIVCPSLSSFLHTLDYFS